MAMNKKQLAEMEELKTLVSFRRTEEIFPDLDIPEHTQHKLVLGWGFNSYTYRAYKSCSSSIYHGEGWERTSTQNPIKQYSSELLALKAMRFEVEMRLAKELRKIDLLIESKLSPPKQETDNND